MAGKRTQAQRKARTRRTQARGQRRSPNRRGAVMIVVLSLLILFTLIGITFVIVASRYKRSAEAVARTELKRDDPRDELDIAMYQLFRDSKGRSSSLAGHSLLRDFYGTEHFKGEVTTLQGNPSFQVKGELLGFYCDFPEYNPPRGDNSYGKPSLHDDYFAGSVLTMTSGPAAGLSTRVVHYEAAPWKTASATPKPTATNFPPRLVVEAFQSSNSQSTRGPTNQFVLPRNGDTFLINGKPFNGTGAGYRWQSNGKEDLATTGTNSLDSPLGGRELSLLPHYARYSQVNYNRLQGDLNNDGISEEFPGDSDEGYDALDYNNMPLAMVPPTVNSSAQIVPSFHRIALVNYWEKQILGTSGSGTTPNPDQFFDLMNHVVFRPMPWDHEQFTGGNARAAEAYAMAMGDDGKPGKAGIDDDMRNGKDDPRELGADGSDDNLGALFTFLRQGNWDIDNDGDGIRDSIWVDIDMPIKTTKEGRLYKPLYSFLVQDMDGRLNLNAHGNLVQLEQPFYQGTRTGSYAQQSPPVNPAPNSPYGNATEAQVYLPRGRGVGPAEFHLQHIFGDAGQPLTDNNEYRAILLGRYGSDQAPGSAQNSTDNDEVLSAYKTLGIPNNYFGSVSSYLTQPDRWGRGTVALDYNGQPIVGYAGFTMTGSPVAYSTQLDGDTERLDDPYELNLLSPSGADQPFEAAELERLLRFYDKDVTMLPSRLLELAPRAFQTGSNARENRRLVTTHSSHVPAPRRVRIPHIQVDVEVVPDPGPGPGLSVEEVLHKFKPGQNITIDGITVVNPVAIGIASPTIVDVIAARLFIHDLQADVAAVADGTIDEITPLTSTDIRQQLRLMLPFEIRHGEKMDLNRAFGNGSDDNGNINTNKPPAVADEGGEGNVPSGASNRHENVFGANADLLNNYNSPYGEGNDTLARQMYARHLYCMMMFMLDENFTFPFAEKLTPPDPLSGFKPEFEQKMTARRVAQWAINVADFRDADAIMSPFEFDENPYDGWQPAIDGNPATDESATGTNTANQRRLVWGCEFPDLLLTESLAMHDRRVKDLKEDDGASPGKRINDAKDAEEDNDLDQYRIPQGSLFLELYCPRTSDLNGNPLNSSQLLRMPNELYSKDPNTGEYYVDLGRTAGSSDSPVWRIVISEPHIGTDDQEKDPSDRKLIDKRNGKSGIPDSISFQPENMRPILQAIKPAAPLDTLAIDRTIVFTTDRPTDLGLTENESGKYFYNRNPDINRDAGSALMPNTYGVKPGQYALIGPRVRTHFGMALPGGMAMNSDPVVSPQLIDMGATVVRKVNGTSTYPNLADIHQPVNIVVGADRPNSWASPNFGSPNTAPNNSALPFIGVNISEPHSTTADYYDEPLSTAKGITPDGVRHFVDAYYDPDNPPTGVMGYPDTPFDKNGNSKPISEDSEGDKDANGLQPTNTYENYRTAFLQRLANPLIPFDSDSNPYITIDWATLDLTVFNGEDNSTEFDGTVDNNMDELSALNNKFDPSDPGRYSDKQHNIWLRTRPRGTKTNPQANLYAQKWINPKIDGAAGKTYDTAKGPSGEDPHLQNSLEHTLGYLNWESLVDNTGIANAMHDSSIGNRYKGSPKKPFPWLTWNDRLFANHLELLMIPASAPGRLLHEFNENLSSTANAYQAHHTRNPYQPPDPMGGGGPEAEVQAIKGHFGHLLNFFHSSYENSGGNQVVGANFFRIANYVEVPSPYVGTEKWYNPDDFQNLVPSPGGVLDPRPAADQYRTPFNKLSRFRDPGLVNINTINDPRIWQALMRNFAPMDPQFDGGNSWDNFVESRRGYSSPGFNDDYPTQIANPFRSPDEASLVPIVSGMQNMKKPSVAVSLLRPGEGADGDVPLLDNLSPETDPPLELLFNDADINNQYDYHSRAPELNSTRNPYFRYQAMTRLGNMVTTTSNVYAVWITVGYFEVHPWRNGIDNGPQVFDAAHPDGLQLGQEIGALTGEVERHRAFYLIDRSIPVAFEPGENHNVDRAVLIRRFIE